MLDVAIDPHTKLGQCEPCQLTKSVRKAMKRGPIEPTKACGDLLHADVVSVPTTLLGGKTGFVTFIDDHSRYWFHLLIWMKDEVSLWFEEVLASLPCDICI